MIASFSRNLSALDFFANIILLPSCPKYVNFCCIFSKHYYIYLFILILIFICLRCLLDTLMGAKTLSPGIFVTSHKLSIRIHIKHFYPITAIGFVLVRSLSFFSHIFQSTFLLFPSLILLFLLFRIFNFNFSMPKYPHLLLTYILYYSLI